MSAHAQSCSEADNTRRVRHLDSIPIWLKLFDLRQFNVWQPVCFLQQWAIKLPTAKHRVRIDG
jgi:hypothetical protein